MWIAFYVSYPYFKVKWSKVSRRNFTCSHKIRCWQLYWLPNWKTSARWLIQASCSNSPSLTQYRSNVSHKYAWTHLNTNTVCAGHRTLRARYKPSCKIKHSISFPLPRKDIASSIAIRGASPSTNMRLVLRLPLFELATIFLINTFPSFASRGGKHFRFFSVPTSLTVGKRRREVQGWYMVKAKLRNLFAPWACT